MSTSATGPGNGDYDEQGGGEGASGGAFHERDSASGHHGPDGGRPGTPGTRGLGGEPAPAGPAADLPNAPDQHEQRPPAGQDPYVPGQDPHTGRMQGGYGQDPAGSAPAPQGGYQQGGYQQGGYQQAGYQQGGYQQGGYPQSGYQQAGYQQGGYQQTGYQQAGYNQGPFRRPYGPQKSRVIAGVLGILLGSLGIHRFYLGFTTIGIIQILMSTVGAAFTFGLSAVAAGIWGLIEGIMILVGSEPFRKDAQGIPLKD
ncbi:TM2 domain-containing protein [Arthrobacter sp. NPDC092385]|uniref:TM2 domain-containing protein n=1 Tax=Arthrobacter sp. NPDC092385 TaxID=3363943 RepID=UPI003822D44C